MAYTKIVFARPDIPPGMNDTFRTHWQKKREQKKRFGWLIRLKGFEKHAGQVRVKIHYKTVKLRDWDNMASSAKFILDALVKQGCIKDDSPEFIPDPPEISQERVSSYKLVRWTIEIFDL